MENRITRLIIPICIGLLAFMLLQQFLGNGDKQTPGDQARRVLNEKNAVGVKDAATSAYGAPLQLGEPGEVGFNVRFHTLGGSIATVDLLDQYPHAGISDEDKLKLENVYRVIEAEEGLFSFVMEDFLGSFALRLPDKVKRQLDPGNTRKLFRMEEVYWQRKAGGENEVVFELALENGLVFEKRYRFFQKLRHFQLVIRIKNTNAEKNELGGYWKYHLRGATVLANPRSEWGFFNNALCFGQMGDELNSVAPTNAPNPISYPDVARGGRFDFAGSGSRFYMCVFTPDNEETRKAVEAVKAASAPFENDAVPDTKAFSNITSILQTKQLIPNDASEGPSELTFNVYLGPKDPAVIDDDPDYAVFAEAPNLDLQAGCCFPGGPTMAKVLRWILNRFQSVVGNWGIAIIFLTIVVKLILLPINYRQQKAMRVYGDKVKKFKPKMDEIKERYKKNPQKMNQELLKIQKENKLFPPLMGCLPMLLTMPVWIGLFMMLRTAFELRHEPFFLWITDLSLPDRLFYLGGPNLSDLISGCFPLPDFTYFNLLPFLFTAFWVINSFTMTLSDDPQQRSMQRMMRYMPIMFMVMLYNYASGLGLYMTVSALWSFVEMRIIKKKLGVATMTSM